MFNRNMVDRIYKACNDSMLIGGSHNLTPALKVLTINHCHSNMADSPEKKFDPEKS